MKKWLISSLLIGMTSVCSGQEPTLRDVFRQIPDSLMPSLSMNNRLDFIDFLDSNMKAAVRNQLGGMSEMTVLTDDSLSVRMSDALRIDMLLLMLDEPVDTIRQVVVFAETFLTDSVYGETTLKFYTPDWQLITRDNIPWNEIQKKRIDSLILQNILKWDEVRLNKS
ncbi:MAG: DUF3256 family protein [Prevotella sp.]|nr:DUF3256 family protein [Prevotella sp.]MBR0165841.1 DUF3256 family protein [Prevotella sp.]